jgi:predicted  nucleic acid-binding Zn-ribbon protein
MPFCNKCGQRIQSGRLCQTHLLADRDGDDVDVDQNDPVDDSTPVECTQCGTRYDHDGQACPECGSRRRRFVGDDDQDDGDGNGAAPLVADGGVAPVQSEMDGDLYVYRDGDLQELAIEAYSQLSARDDLTDQQATEIADLFHTLHRLDVSDLEVSTR